MSQWEFKFNQVNKKVNTPNPFGFSKEAQDEGENVKNPKEMKDLLRKKIKSFATSGASQIFMVLLMMYMTGSGLNIFTIIFTFQFIYNPAKTLLNTNSSFKQFEGKGIPLLQYKLLYAGINGVIFFIGLYKLYNLGLLPLSPSDWIDLIPLHQQNEKVFEATI